MRLKAFRRSTLAGAEYFAAVNRSGRWGWPYKHRLPARVDARVRAAKSREHWAAKAFAPHHYEAGPPADRHPPCPSVGSDVRFDDAVPDAIRSAGSD